MQIEHLQEPNCPIEDMSDAQRRAYDAYLACEGSLKKAAVLLNRDPKTVKERLELIGIYVRYAESENVFDSKYPIFKGSIQGRHIEKRAIPKSGTKRYLVTNAVTGAYVFKHGFESLLKCAEYYNAEIMISTSTYDINRFKALQGAEKRGADKKEILENTKDFIDPKLEPYIKDVPVLLAPDLMFCGHFQKAPTTENPFSGLDNYHGNVSCIYPHPRIEFKTVPTTPNKPPKHMYSTGAITLKQYTETALGAKGEWHHTFGALIVEVDSDGDWFVRQLYMHDDGQFEDIDPFGNYPALRFTPKGITPSKVLSFQAGDIHVRQLEDVVKKSIWGDGGLIDIIKPKYDFYHDILDFESRSHHNRNNFRVEYELHINDKDDVFKEIDEGGDFVEYAKRPWKEDIVVNSNHDNHLNKWIYETNWKDDKKNSWIYLKLALKIIEVAIEKKEKTYDVDYFNLLEYALKEVSGKGKHLKFLAPGESFTVADIECGLHGDKGVNGARGSLNSYTKAGSKINVGHSHSPGIKQGAFQSGVAAKLRMSYNREGLSSWDRSHILIMNNGKRMILTQRVVYENIDGKMVPVGVKYKGGKLRNGKPIRQVSKILEGN